MNKNIYIMMAAGVALALASCKNSDIEFGDFDYQTVYFANQSPVRTITLGEDAYSTDLDNEHRFEVYARLGGVESNKTARTINIAVDDNLCDGLVFDDGTAVTPLPAGYYELGGNVITIGEGQTSNCVGVQLTDAFFADTLSTGLHYVLPLKMLSASDSILSGKDFTLYAVKYKNKYHGCWLSKGNDKIWPNGMDSTYTRQPEDWEDADLVYLTTDGLKKSRYQVTVTVVTGVTNGVKNVETKTCDLILTFDDNDNCTISTDTEGCTATGTGKWTYHGLAKAWGQKDRDQLDLDYTVTFTYDVDGVETTTYLQTTETLCMRDRQSKFETFTYTENK